MTQIPLFEIEEQKPRVTIHKLSQPMPRPGQRIHGLIQRGIDELQATRQADWIKRTHNLKFRRQDDHSKGSTP